MNQFLPRAGEALDITVVRPGASTGETLAVDRVDLQSNFGDRLTTTTLEFGYRSSRGGRPEIRTNVRTALSLGENRWILFTHGKGVGPAILYWGELALFIVVAWLLGRIGGTPLRTRDWLFLGLGLSTFSWWVLLLFAGWIFVLARRDRWDVPVRWQFNLLQLVLGAFTLVALAVVVSAIPFGLLGEPNMGLRPMYPSDTLSWFNDRTGPDLAAPFVISVSIWFYKLAMLLWALWLSFALLRWLSWAWNRFTSRGVWKSEEGVAA